MKIENLTEEKRLLEENIQKEAILVDQNKLVQDLQIENKSLAEKVNNYQLILSNTIETELSLIKEKLELETKAKTKLKEELISVQEQLKSANSPQCDRYGTPDGLLQSE
ncbi:hypothetical protein Avbf_01601, partial [Armadillidium vulgare]